VTGVCSRRSMTELDKSHIETLIIYRLNSREITTQNDRYW